MRANAQMDARRRSRITKCMMGLLSQINYCRRDKEGAAIVEMGLVSIVLFAFIFGIFQLSITLYCYNAVNEAAREGARWAIVRGSQCGTNTPSMDNCGASSADIQSYVRSLGYPYSSSMNVSATWCNVGVDSKTGATTWPTPPCTGSKAGTKDPGNEVSVVVTMNLPMSVPFIQSFPLTLNSTSTMVISQ